VDRKEGIDLVKNSSKDYAFIAQKEFLVYQILTNGPKFFYLPPKIDESSFSLQLFGIAMHKEFEFKKQFNKLYKKFIFEKKILKIKFFFSISDSKSAGLIYHWEITEYRKLFKINLDDFDFTQGINQKYVRLNLYQLQSTLYLFCCGNLFALFSLLIEFFTKYYQWVKLMLFQKLIFIY
jgi:hypothetical protein